MRDPQDPIEEQESRAYLVWVLAILIRLTIREPRRGRYDPESITRHSEVESVWHQTRAAVPGATERLAT